MSDIERDLNKVFQAERKATQAPKGLADVVARQAGRRRMGVFAGTAAVGLVAAGAIATLGLTFVRTPAPAAAPTDPIDVRLSIDTLGGAANGGLGLADYCGGAAPSAAPITEHFALTPNVQSFADDLSTSLVDDGQGGIGVPNVRGDSSLGMWGQINAARMGFPDIVALTPRADGVGGILSGWLFVQDGVVVGFLDFQPAVGDPSTGLSVWSANEPLLLSAVTPIASVCETGGPTSTRGEWATLPVGEYEAYPVVRVDTSIQYDAIHYLADQGISPQPLSYNGTSAPGSWDCEQAIASGDLAPVDCVEGYLDAGTRSVAVTVPPAYQSPEIHDTLIGNPIPYSRSGSPSLLGSEFRENAPTFDYCTNEQLAQWGIDLSAPPSSGPDPILYWGQGNIDSLRSGASVTIDGLLLGPAGQDGTLTGLTDLSAGLVARPEMLPIFDVGHASATVSGGGPVTLDRYVGPTPITLEIDDAVWCGAPLPADVELGVVISGTATFTDADGQAQEQRIAIVVDRDSLPLN